MAVVIGWREEVTVYRICIERRGKPYLSVIIFCQLPLFSQLLLVYAYVDLL